MNEVMAPIGANKITENLWMGSAPPEGDHLKGNFDCLVLCATEYQPEFFPGLEVLRNPLHDDGVNLLSQDHKRASIRTAKLVIDRIRDGKTVLVTCVQGRNRSGLVCALTLMMGGGASGTEAINAVRAARGPTALMNMDFVDFIDTVEQALGNIGPI